jgi:PilZ domain
LRTRAEDRCRERVIAALPGPLSLTLITAYDNRGRSTAFALSTHASLNNAGVQITIHPTTVDGIRQSDRVSLRLQVEACWSATGGAAVKQPAETLLVSRNGGVIRLQEKLFPGQELTLERKLEGDQTKLARARIVAEIDREPEGFIYAIAILEPRVDFWDIDFPAPHKGEEALARMLMECSFCQRREVVYLNEMELKSFEIRKCAARHCKHCDSPSIWIEAQSESANEDLLPSRNNATDDRVVPRRNRTRVKARVLACIRRRGFQEEIAVCEDLSKGGISFRSRNSYPAGTRLEVAVPYTPGAGAIFVPIRIVSSQPIASVGLFRHGAAYLRPPE